MKAKKKQSKRKLPEKIFVRNGGDLFAYRDESGLIADPEVGANLIVGEYALIRTHLVKGTAIQLEPLTWGKSVTAKQLKKAEKKERKKQKKAAKKVGKKAPTVLGPSKFSDV